jgi:hypothetical protein
VAFHTGAASETSWPTAGGVVLVRVPKNLTKSDSTYGPL